MPSCVFKKGAEGDHTHTHTHTHRRGCSDRADRDAKTLALKTRGMQPQAKKGRQPQKLKETKIASPLESLEGPGPC